MTRRTRRCCDCGRLLYEDTGFYRTSRGGYQRRCKTCNVESGNEVRRRQRSAAVAMLGSICARCGFDDIRALQIDHVNGGGAQETRRGGYQRMVARIARGMTEGYQLLCANCNWIKRHENGEALGAPRRVLAFPQEIVFDAD